MSKRIYLTQRITLLRAVPVTEAYCSIIYQYKQRKVRIANFCPMVLPYHLTQNLYVRNSAWHEYSGEVFYVVSGIQQEDGNLILGQHGRGAWPQGDEDALLHSERNVPFSWGWVSCCIARIVRRLSPGYSAAFWLKLSYGFTAM